MLMSDTIRFHKNYKSSEFTLDSNEPNWQQSTFCVSLDLLGQSALKVYCVKRPLGGDIWRQLLYHNML